MADEEDRSFSPSQARANRARSQGPGVGASEMNRQRDPNLGRDEVGLGDVEGDLGAGTPANVDVHKLGQEDRPEEDWGEPAGEGATHSANHTRRAEKTEAERGQGGKTRAFNKDIVSRRT